MSRFFDVPLNIDSSKYIYLDGIKIDSQYVNYALPNINLSFITSVTVRPNVRKKGGRVGC